AKAVVVLHNGRLSAASEGQNKGSVFTVELETMAAVPEALATEAPVLPPKGGQHKILLVEDNADTLRILSRLLQKWGYVVQCADCVAKARDLAANDTFDILVSDIGLPDGSGLDIMREMKERRGLRGIALSGYGTDDDIRQSRAAGFEEHLTKPIGVESLRTAVERILAGKRP
ncbi:MAG: response regulator, partial [Chthoniobacteraceae bacterium]|nr:response regulator [Chthoniobacteraceae bacterium]